MSKGKAKVDYLATQGLVTHQNAPSWDFIYEVSSVKSDKWNVGDRVVLPDGREFRYGKSVGACHAGHGCEFTYTGYTAITNFAVSEVVGVKEITVPAATHAVLAQDELRGGYVTIFDGASDNYTTLRGIIGNDSAVADAAFKIYLDAAITYAITAATSKCETYQNPYAALQDGASNTLAKAGLPAAYVSASGKYFWVQTKGLTWVSPHAGLGGSQGQHGGFWRHDGAIDKADTALAVTVPAGSSSQYAGYCVTGSQAGNGPLFNLQG